MIDYGDFNDHVDAHLLLALSLPQAEALDIFDRRLADGSWRRSSRGWLHRLLALRNFDYPDDLLRPRFLAFASALLKTPVDGHPATTFPTVMGVLGGDEEGRGLVARLCVWFADGAPRTEAMLRDGMEALWSTVRGKQEKCADSELRPLVTWILRWDLETLVQEGKYGVPEPVVRLLLADGGGEAKLFSTALRWYLRIESASGWQERAEAFWPLIERYLDLGLPWGEVRAPVFGEFLSSPDDFSDPGHHPLLATGAFPRCRIALFADLVGGVVVGALAQHAWRTLLCAESAELTALRFASMEGLNAAVAAMREAATDGRSGRGLTRTGPSRTSCRFIVGEFLRLSGWLESPDAVDRLQFLAGWGPSLDGAIQDALRLGDHQWPNEPEFRLARRLLAEKTEGSGVVAAILVIISGAVRRRAADADRALPEADFRREPIPSPKQTSALVTAAPAIVTSIPKPPRSGVFISYAHKDRKWLDDVKAHLGAFQNLGLLACWDDTQLEPGRPWREEIKNAIATASVGLLLVSPEFLGSRFIKDNELPPLLAAAEEDGVQIFSLIVRHCAFEDFPDLARLQALNRPNRPLARERPAMRDETLAVAARKITSAAARGQ